MTICRVRVGVTWVTIWYHAMNYLSINTGRVYQDRLNSQIVVDAQDINPNLTQLWLS